MSTVKLIPTADGSNTLFHEASGEHYHSLKGAVGESMHVFIKHGLYHIALKKSAINILEIGFGTGLNALLTLLEGQKMRLNIQYTGVETLLLGADTYRQLGYAKALSINDADYLQIMQCKWNTWHKLTDNFALLKLEKKIQEAELTPDSVDLIYFDAFAPSRQPEMWTPEIIKKMYHLATQGGVLVTYCAQANFKRYLKAEGFEVERLPGALGKREMTRAIKI